MIGPSLPVRDCPLSYKRAMFAIYRFENPPGIQLMNTYLTCDSPLRDRRAMFCCTLYQSSNFVIELSHFVLTLLALLIKKTVRKILFEGIGRLVFHQISLYPCTRTPPPPPTPPRANPYLITTQSNRLKFI